MSTYIEYQLEDGSTVLVEAEAAEDSGIVPAATRGGDQRLPSKVNFKDAFSSVKGAIKEVIAEFDDLHIDEAEIKFGLKATAEAGVFAISKVGGEMTYEVTLKWRKPE